MTNLALERLQHLYHEVLFKMTQNTEVDILVKRKRGEKMQIRETNEFTLDTFF